MSQIEIPGAIAEVFANPDGSYRASRYKVLYGGRGGAKSWGMARVAIALANSSRKRILCAREYQSSIRDSVHKLLKDQIYEMGLQDRFSITDKAIHNILTGSEFLFKGLRRNLAEVKSTEGIDICWVEEARSVSKESWQVVRPTIRAPGSEIWISFNPEADTDPTFVDFVVNPPPGAVVQKVGWEDNPWFPDELDKERRACLATDPDAYEWIWGGGCRQVSEAVIFGKRVSFESFDEPEGVRPFLGGDWGFANDPTALIRSYIEDDCLFVTHEAFGYQVELDDLPALFEGGYSQDGSRHFEGVPGAKEWPIKADSARPETISYMRRQGFNISAADKWPGCVEDGVAHLKGFKRIVIHERCKHMSAEARLYSYKVDKVTGEVLPIIVDKHNHGWDAIRYSLDGYIQARGGHGVWAKLAG